MGCHSFWLSCLLASAGFSGSPAFRGILQEPASRVVPEVTDRAQVGHRRLDHTAAGSYPGYARHMSRSLARPEVIPVLKLFLRIRR